MKIEWCPLVDDDVFWPTILNLECEKWFVVVWNCESCMGFVFFYICFENIIVLRIYVLLLAILLIY